MTSSILIRNGLLVTMNHQDEVFPGDLLIESNRIKNIWQSSSATQPEKADQVLDASGCLVLPGFIQTHTHLCQTLFRGMAEGLPLLRWLKERIWPLEATLTEESLYGASQLGISELLASGTTSILDMGTVRHTDAIFRAASEMGIRAWIGNALMDSSYTPSNLRDNTQSSLRTSENLFSRWHGKENGRLSYAPAPRFALSCTEKLLREINAFASENSLLIHTHAAEQQEEVALVKKETGFFNIEWHNHLGMASPRLCLAHAVWPKKEEMGILKKNRVKILHCPSSNAKLGSGIAPVRDYLNEGISVSLGADGAACNNALDMFLEMRAAAQMQSLKYGPGALSAKEIVAMATREGAKALGKERELGSLEKGYLADLILLDVSAPSSAGASEDPYTYLVFGAKSEDLRTTIVDGKILVKDRHILPLGKQIGFRDKIIRWRKTFEDILLGH